MKNLPIIAIASFVALVVLAPSGAYARSYTTPDPAHDVMSQFEGGGGPEAAPTRAEGDVLASGVTHRPRRVIVSMRYAAMTQTTHETVHQFRILTNEGKLRRVFVAAGPRHWDGNPSMTKGQGQGVEVRCSMTTALNYAQNRVTVSIPRRCLSSPRWVRVGFKSMTMENGIFFTDDGQTGAPLSGYPVFGPPVRRG